MICPECKMEYNPGITRCADCRKDLVHELPVISHDLNHDYLFLVETLNLSDIAIIESILKGSNIQYIIAGEAFNLMRPLVEPVRFYVRDNQLIDAKVLLKDVNLRYMALVASDRQEPKEQSGS
jgi:hypothetical protein